MSADLIYDFDNHLADGRVWKVTLELPMSDGEQELNYTVDYYAVANNSNQAIFTANTQYPDATSISVDTKPVSPSEYASRKDSSNL